MIADMTAIPKPAPPSRMTADEFLAWAGDERYELVDGHVRAMSPPSEAHGTIQITLGSLLRAHLRTHRPGCRVVGESAVVPRLRSDMNVRVPDLGVTCAPRMPGATAIPEPLLVVEILSPSNERDTWENVRAYATIPSVQEILLVQSTRVEAHVLRRGRDGQWPERPETISGSEMLRLESVGFSAALTQLYLDTHLDSSAT